MTGWILRVEDGEEKEEQDWTWLPSMEGMLRRTPADVGCAQTLEKDDEETGNHERAVSSSRRCSQNCASRQDWLDNNAVSISITSRSLNNQIETWDLFTPFRS